MSRRRAAPERGAQVRVQIEELRLEGFDPRHRYRIASALEHELARLFRARAAAGEFTAPDDAARIDAGAFSFSADESPVRIGVAIARATFRGLTASASRGRDPHGG